MQSEWPAKPRALFKFNIDLVYGPLNDRDAHYTINHGLHRYDGDGQSISPGGIERRNLVRQTFEFGQLYGPAR